jgi:hypothetical protein
MEELDANATTKPTHRSRPKVRALPVPDDICFVRRGVLATNVAVVHALAEEGVYGWLAGTTCVRYARRRKPTH